MVRNFSINDILQAYQRKGYPVNQGNKKIMLTGIRSNDQTPNIFNDTMVWVQWVGPAAKLKQAPFTTDPGLFYLENPMNTKGTAIVKPGFYPDLWRIGIHKNYEALVQNAPVTVIRDFNRDAIIDYNSGREETGMFGIDCHRAYAVGTAQAVDNVSAGCQAVADADQFSGFMWDCKNSINQTFDYGLLLESDFM